MLKKLHDYTRVRGDRVKKTLQMSEGQKSRSYEICPGLTANEMHAPRDRHHKVPSSIKVHQNTHNFVKYEVI